MTSYTEKSRESQCQFILTIGDNAIRVAYMYSVCTVNTSGQQLQYKGEVLLYWGKIGVILILMNLKTRVVR